MLQIIITLLSSLILLTGCKGQTSKKQSSSSASSQNVGGPFENSDYLYKQIPVKITSVDTSPGWKEPGTKLLVTGKVYHRDAKTPAADILIYYYHTNSEGSYQHKPGEPRSMPPNEKGQTHGNIRGWVKTDNQGRYSIYT
ncbi:MAG: dioxygenase family protein, partial [Flavitalea sp.]